MPELIEFSGFQEETLKFLYDLSINNNKSWFEENRHIFNEYVLGPAQAFVVELGNRLMSIAPEVVADPRIDKSIFRFHRDVRFSKNKEPYKTHIGLLFWEGPFKKMENSGFYMQVNSKSIFLGAGLYQFPKHIMHAYREAIVDKQKGKTFKNAINEVSQKSDFQFGGLHYKRVPRGFDAEHPYAQWLMHNGIFAHKDYELPKEFFSELLVDFCFDEFRKMAPIHNWLVKLTNDLASQK